MKSLFVITCALTIGVSSASFAQTQTTSRPSVTTSTKTLQMLRCKDGTVTTVANRSGACSGHGGIAPSDTAPKK